MVEAVTKEVRSCHLGGFGPAPIDANRLTINSPHQGRDPARAEIANTVAAGGLVSGSG